MGSQVKIMKNLVWILLLPDVFCIDCYVCSSLGSSNSRCETLNVTYGIQDPFYQQDCLAGRKSYHRADGINFKYGLFPASACIKLSGKYVKDKSRLTIRGCVVDSGSLTADTEIIRQDYCGHFYFEGRYVHGCIKTCDDADGCNGAF